MADLPMSMSPLPPMRSSGDLTSRSSLCATPFLIEKLAESSAKSVLSLLSAACPDCLPAAARALRSSPAMSMPLIAPSRRRTFAAPESDRFIAPAVAPAAASSSATLPFPSRRSWCATSLTSGPIGEIVVQIEPIDVEVEAVGRLRRARHRELALDARFVEPGGEVEVGELDLALSVPRDAAGVELQVAQGDLLPGASVAVSNRRAVDVDAGDVKAHRRRLFFPLGPGLLGLAFQQVAEVVAPVLVLD